LPGKHVIEKGDPHLQQLYNVALGLPGNPGGFVAGGITGVASVRNC